MNSARHSEAGFSLIETVVAVFIVALISAGAGIMLTQTVQAGKQASASGDALIQLQIANAMMRDDFASITARHTASSDPFDQPQIFVGQSADRDTDFLTFARHGWSLAPSGELRSDLQRVAYRFEEGQLIRKAWLRPDPDRETPVVERVLLSGMTDVRISYGKSGFWESEWQSRFVEDDLPLLPDALELICEFENGDVFRQVFLTGMRS